jgi:fluoride ion exporter CrcB/FEX
MLYIGLASGYCGGVTTISGWQVQASLEILRPQIMDGLLALLVGFCTFFSSFKFGLHLGKVAKRLYRKRYKKKPKNTTQPESIQPTQTISPWRWHWEHILAISAATTLWAFFGLLFVFVKPSRTWSGAAFLAPWGTGIRWYISRWNVIWPRFRLPTFIVNFIGSTLYAILFVLKCKEESAKHALASSILSALIIGFCGTMTTASTFTSELRDIKNPKWAYLYGFATVIGIQASCLLVFGITESVSDIDLYLDDYR